MDEVVEALFASADNESGPPPLEQCARLVALVMRRQLDALYGAEDSPLPSRTSLLPDAVPPAAALLSAATSALEEALEFSLQQLPVFLLFRLAY